MYSRENKTTPSQSETESAIGKGKILDRPFRAFYLVGFRY